MNARELNTRVACGAVIHAALMRYTNDRAAQAREVDQVLVQESDAYNALGFREDALAEDFLTYVHAAVTEEIEPRFLADTELAEWSDLGCVSRIDVMRVLHRAREMTASLEVDAYAILNAAYASEVGAAA